MAPTKFSVASKKRTKYLKIKQKENFFPHLYAALNYLLLLLLLLNFTHFHQLSITLSPLSPFHFPTRISNSYLSLRDFVANIFPVFLSLFFLYFACCAFLIIHTCSLNHKTIMFLLVWCVHCCCFVWNLIFGVWNLIKSALI